ncbi:MAG: hypothetical protein KC736_01435 [Candidatus Moranbacteria bacterium]|nr:hypothetical protein [Candidatus Moranbacteria bacterium]
MQYGSIYDLAHCYDVLASIPTFNLVYYSHIPTALLGFLVGFFVFYNLRNLLGGLLFFSASMFSLWAVFDLLTWHAANSVLVMFSWSLLGIFYVLFFASIFYFYVVYVTGKDISFWLKLCVIFVSLPVIFLLPTTLNLSGFDGVWCESIEGSFYTNYYYFVGFLFVFFAVVVFLRSIFTASWKKRLSRGEFYSVSFGVLLLMLCFSWANVIASFTLNWQITQIGLFGMPLFVVFLAYAIVRFHAFSLRIFAAQILVIGMVVLVGSQLFFVEKVINTILILWTLVVVVGLGYLLVRSVIQDLRRKEELQKLTEKLAKANQQLRKLDQAKSDFVSIASHQLRTPLTAIKGFVSMISEGSYGKVEEPVKEALGKVFLANERLITLVEELLSISRIESGRIEYNFALGRVETLAKEIVDTFLVTARQKNLDLNLILPDVSTPKIKMDQAKLHEVFLNIVDNALKYTREGSVTVSVEHDEKRDVVRFIVADTGIGVTPESLSSIFQKFSRGKDVGRLHADGTGLGLFIGKSFVEAHHGQIIVESDGADKGSRFIVELPVHSRVLEGSTESHVL